MRLDIITLFPRMCEAPLSESIIGRAQAEGRAEIRVIDLRDFAHDRHRTVDDKPYGGGAGMVLMAGPLFEAVESVAEHASRVVLLTPQGRRFNQGIARGYATECEHIVLVCGHYEGVDERARQVLFDDEISIGDFVLTNGAIAAVLVADAVVRLLPGVLGCDASSEEESFGDRHLLEYPQYTRPRTFRGMRVPDVLMSGDHGMIERWRSEQRIVRTAGRRPDLLSWQMETCDE
jgi:tRNA (guanine37-N1)-methyltransferase